jgi:Kdo2-lipid IVA lauroyltransferase/acyltransferase
MKTVVRIENPELAAGAMTPDKGAIMLLAHMGNWEALAYVFTLLLPPGHKAGTIYRFLNNPYMDDHIKAVRRRVGLELFEKRSSPLAMAAFVRSGGALGILSDQRAEAAGEIVPFFGRLTSCTPLPAILSRRLGVPVIGLSMRTEKPGSWVIKLHLLKEAPSTLACMQLLEEMIRESPSDVFWLQDRWRISRSAPLVLSGRPPNEAALASCTKPRRALVWIDPMSMPEKPAPTLPDIAWECSVLTGEIPQTLPDWLPAAVKVHPRRADCVSMADLRDELLRIDQTSSQPLDVVLLNPQQHPAIAACRQLGLAVQIETQP